MFSWFRSQPECPIEPEMRDWINTRWAWLEEQFGTERLCATQVILPNSDFFPDPYHGTKKDAEALFKRVCGYMELDHADMRLSFYEERKQPGTAGLYRAEGKRFHIEIEITNLHDPLAMVATMAHELGHVHLLGQRRLPEDADDHEPLTDLLTVYLGMGVFTANSVIRENYWHAGQISGWSIGRRGYLTMVDYGYAFARFSRARHDDGKTWVRELRLDVRTAYKQAMRYLAAIDNQDGPT